MTTVTYTQHKAYVVFYREFLAVKARLSSNGGESAEDRLLAIMFLHLTLEGLISYYLRQAMEIVFWANYPLRAIWLRHEKKQLGEKVKFFQEVFLPFKPETPEFKSWERFVELSSKYRNWIVHGHSLHVLTTADNATIGGSDLYTLLEKIDLEKHHAEFRRAIDYFMGELAHPPVRNEDMRPDTDWLGRLVEVKSEIVTP